MKDNLLHALTESPCIFCSYSGKNYYQEGSHLKHCPWHAIGGLTERKKMLPTVIIEMFSHQISPVHFQLWANLRGETPLPIKSYLLEAGDRMGNRDVTIERRVQEDGKILWGIHDGSGWLSKDGFWDCFGFEPTKAELKRTRFPTPQAAMKHYIKWKGDHPNKQSAHIAHSKRHGLIK